MRPISDDRGISVIEMMVAMLITAVISAIMLSWVVAVLRTDEFQQDELEALDQMRLAKARLVKELRFATIIDPDSTTSAITFAVELGGASGPDLSGELVTWSIESDGTMVRYVDNDPDTAVVQATVLVAAESGFAYDPGGTLSPVTITLVADVATGTNPAARSIRIQVHARNA